MAQVQFGNLGFGSLFLNQSWEKGGKPGLVGGMSEDKGGIWGRRMGVGEMVGLVVLGSWDVGVVEKGGKVVLELLGP